MIMLCVSFPWLIFFLFRSQLNSAFVPTVQFVLLVFSIAWLSFAIWRMGRMIKAGAIRGDRKYDYEIKHGLSHDYADTESRTKSKRRSLLASLIKR